MRKSTVKPVSELVLQSASFEGKHENNNLSYNKCYFLHLVHVRKLSTDGVKTAYTV